jgi:polyferredoxin
VSACLYAEETLRFPPPEFTVPYKFPAVTQPSPRANALELLDVGLLVVALSLATWIALRARSRKWMVALSIACLAYFGFYRAGCICPIGAIQNVTQGLFDPRFYLPLTVVAFFALPLVFCLLFGRVFCSGVCWLGAIQDLVLMKPIHLPMWLQRSLRVVPFLYLGTGVLFAATGAAYIICDYDPFVSFFRLAGSVAMLVTAGIVLLASTFIGRPYCRFLCPYGAILGLLSRVSWKGVTITPDHCVNCGMCRHACPFGAIQPSSARKEGKP